MSYRLPMFPLGSVLFPSRVLTLHVFEPRYRQLVRDCLAADHPDFGVVLIERGSEVGGGDTRSSIGTVARMVEVAETADGRFAVVAMGYRRVRVQQWLPDAPYPLAEVDDLPDHIDADTVERCAERYQNTVQQARRLAALAAELGESVDATTPFDDDPLRGSFALAAVAPLTEFDRQRVLGVVDPVDRLVLLGQLLDDAEMVLRFRLGADNDL